MHTTMKAAAGGPHRPASPHPRLALIRMVGSDDTVVSVMLEVNRISTKTEQVKLDGSIVGYITRAEHCFIASAEPRPRSAVARGGFDLWDKAAAELLLQRTP